MVQFVPCDFSDYLQDYRGYAAPVLRHLKQCANCRFSASLLVGLTPPTPPAPTPECVDDATLAAFEASPNLEGVEWWDRVEYHTDRCGLCLRKLRVLVAGQESKEGYTPSMKHNKAVAALVEEERRQGRPISTDEICKMAMETESCLGAVELAAYECGLMEGEELERARKHVEGCIYCSTLLQLSMSPPLRSSPGGG